MMVGAGRHIDIHEQRRGREGIPLGASFLEAVISLETHITSDKPWVQGDVRRRWWVVRRFGDIGGRRIEINEQRSDREGNAPSPSFWQAVFSLGMYIMVGKPRVSRGV